MVKRKYPYIKGWWVYSIKIPSINKYYIGVSKQQCNQRWKKSYYKDNSLNQYLDEWDLMEKTVLIDGLSSKKEALIYEDSIIRALKMNDLCVNERRSGLIASDKNTYQREYRENNPESYKHHQQQANQRKKQRYQNDVEYREKDRERKRQRT